MLCIYIIFTYIYIYIYTALCASQVAVVVKNLPAIAGNIRDMNLIPV